MIRLVVSDVDGVLAVKLAGFTTRQVLPEVLVMLGKLQSVGVRATVATGRGYLRALQAIGAFRPDAPLIVEGVKVVATDSTLLHAIRLDDQTFECLKPLFVPENVVFAAAYPLQEPRAIFWVADRAAEQMIGADDLRAIYGRHTTEAVTFFGWLEAEGTAMVTIKPRGEITLPGGVNGVFNEGYWNVAAPGQDKGAALVHLADEVGVGLAETAILVNDWNDLPMARLVSAAGGQIVVVGDRVPELTTLATVRIDTPEELPDALRLLFPEILGKED